MSNENDEAKLQEEKKPAWWSKWEALKAAFPIGHRFDYLDKGMVVVAHEFKSFEAQRHSVGFSPPPLASLVAEYTDDNGVIRQHVFSREPWKLLLPQ